MVRTVQNAGTCTELLQFLHAKGSRHIVWDIDQPDPCPLAVIPLAARRGPAHASLQTSAHHRFRAENRPPCAEYGWLGCSCRRISSRCQRMIPLTSFFDLVSAAAGARAVYAERKLQNFALPRLLFATWRACAAAMPWCSRMRGHCGVAGAFLFAFWVHLHFQKCYY